MSNEFDIEVGYGDDDLVSGGGVTLPFPHLYASVTNQNALAQQPYYEFGGFRVKAEEVDAIVADGVLKKIPDGWGAFQFVTKDNGKIPQYGFRVLKVAFMGVREKWVNKFDKFDFIPHYDKSRPEYKDRTVHILVAALLSVGGEETLFPMVITRGGFGGGWNRTLVNDFVGIVKSLPVKTPSGAALPPRAFFTTIGTFGNKPFTRVAGKGDKTYDLVYLTHDPANVKTNPDYSVKLITDPATFARQSFVGGLYFKQITEWKESARDWLGAWGEGSKESAPASPIVVLEGGENTPF